MLLTLFQDCMRTGSIHEPYTFVLKLTENSGDLSINLNLPNAAQQSPILLEILDT